LLHLAGCAVIVESHVVEARFTDAQADAIRDGVTSKPDVLARLGPPECLVRVPRPAGPDRPLERFTAEGITGAGQTGYGYRRSAIGWADFCAYGQGGGGCIPSIPQRTERMLRIVFDDRTGLVLGHAVEEERWFPSGPETSPWLR
jgi:hypothetical protein